MVYCTYAGEKSPVVYEKEILKMSLTAKVLTISSVILLLLKFAIHLGIVTNQVIATVVAVADIAVDTSTVAMNIR